MREIKKRNYTRYIRSSKKKITELEERIEELDERYIATQDMMQMTANYLHATKDKLQKANQHMQDSIQYAHRIQQAMLDSPDQTKHVFPNSFVLYRPKAVLSGDLYWFRQVMGMDFVAAIDCTGHGVPAAMLTVLALSLLNQVVISFGITDPAEILVQLDILVSQYTQDPSKRQQIRDGFDIVLCQYDREMQELTIAGAHRPLYLIRNGELSQVKGARYSIGANTPRKSNLKNHVLKIEKGDLIYLFSDGYPDQFGGNQNKKYMVGKFKKLLKSIADLPLNEQKQELDAVFKEWKGKKNQTDDVLVIGIKFE